MWVFGAIGSAVAVHTYGGSSLCTAETEDVTYLGLPCGVTMGGWRGWPERGTEWKWSVSGCIIEVFHSVKQGLLVLHW